MKERIRQSAYLVAYLASLVGAFAAAFLFTAIAGDRGSDAGVTAAQESASPSPPTPTLTPVPAPAPTSSSSPASATPAPSADPVGGGYSLSLERADFPVGSTELLRLRVLQPDGAPASLVERAGRTLRLAVVRRDLENYLEPTPQPDGDGWSAPLTLPGAGPYRVLVTFQPEGADAPITLGADVSAAGDYMPVELPPPAPTAATRRYVVALSGAPIAGVESEIAFGVTENGAGLGDLVQFGDVWPQGPVGALAALRADDLVAAQVVPRTMAAPGAAAGSELRFAVTFPAAGTYRLYLDFQRSGGRRHSVAFTVVVPRSGGP